MLIKITYNTGNNLNSHKNLLPSNFASYFISIVVVNGDLEDCSLSHYKRGYLMLFCSAEIITYGDRIVEFKKRNCEVENETERYTSIKTSSNGYIVR